MARRPKRTLSEELEAHRKIVVGLLDACEAMAILYPDVPNYRYAADELGRGYQVIVNRQDESKEFGKRTETATANANEG